MDDGIFLTAAQNVSRNPFFPQDLPVLFEGVSVSDLASTEHPPLTVYFMALCGAIGGFSELCLHVGFLIFPVILGIATYSLARRFTSHPTIVAVGLLCLPVVYVMSHTLMSDLPLVALWTAAVALFVHGVDSSRIGWIAAGAAVAALATFVSYAGLCLAPLLGLYALLRRSRSGLFLALLPLAAFGSWLALNFFHYGRFTPSFLLSHYLLTEKVLSPTLIFRKLIYALVFLGGITICPLALLVLGRKWKILAGLFVGTLMVSVLPFTADYRFAHKFLFVTLFTAGLLTVWAILQRVASALACVKESSGERDDLFLGVWFLGVIFFCALFYLTGAARYLLPATPPLVLLAMRRAEGAVLSKLPALAIATAALTGVTALGLAIADYQFAEIYRDFANKFAVAHRASRKTAWFSGEWGFRTYLDLAGARQLGRRDPRPQAGDCLMVPDLATPYQTLFSDQLSLEAIVLVAPSRVSFQVPALSRDARLLLTVGMPLYDKSDGVELSLNFSSSRGRQPLSRTLLLPQYGRLWSVWNLPLGELEGQPGSVVFSAAVNSSGNADADWVALGRARISEIHGSSEKLIYDFSAHLEEARIEPDPAIEYHTPGNVPVFRMPVWLEQAPAKALLGRHVYRPGFPVRLMDSDAHAGFWSMGWGMLPYSISTRGRALECVSVYSVTRQVDGYGETNPRWAPTWNSR
jgi:4-amino-4-deoxy-L-arabinose transferase-like glycosyltransferase